VLGAIYQYTMKLISTLLLILLLIGCGQSETKKEFYYDGTKLIQEIRYYKNPNDSLTFRKEDFYKSGNKFYTGQLINATKDGKWTWWYENGNKKDECKYADGFYVDTVYHWYESGELKQIEIVVVRTVRRDDCCNCNGTIIRYDENGKLKEKFTSLDDKLQGTYTTYDANGSWNVKTYKDDTLSGPTIEHIIDSAGLHTIIVGQYQNGKETGLWKWFNKDSILTQTAVYKNGEVLKVTKNKTACNIRFDKSSITVCRTRE
jgi:antitoxin component YwqK of YwqJK toxin-antitoxin module